MKNMNLMQKKKMIIKQNLLENQQQKNLDEINIKIHRNKMNKPLKLSKNFVMLMYHQKKRQEKNLIQMNQQQFH
jgi:hypothetical protein